MWIVPDENLHSWEKRVGWLHGSSGTSTKTNPYVAGSMYIDMQHCAEWHGAIRSKNIGVNRHVVEHQRIENVLTSPVRMVIRTVYLKKQI